MASTLEGPAQGRGAGSPEERARLRVWSAVSRTERGFSNPRRGLRREAGLR